MSLEVKEFKKNPQFDEQFHAELVQMITSIAVVITEEAKRLAPVDTGRLRDSIEYTVNETDLSTEIGPRGVEYGLYQEMGTSKMSAQPYLRPAIDNVLSQL